MFAIWRAIMGNTLISERLRVLLTQADNTGTKIVNGMQKTNDAVERLNRTISETKKLLKR